MKRSDHASRLINAVAMHLTRVILRLLPRSKARTAAIDSLLECRRHATAAASVLDEDLDHQTPTTDEENGTQTH